MELHYRSSRIHYFLLIVSFCVAMSAPHFTSLSWLLRYVLSVVFSIGLIFFVSSDREKMPIRLALRKNRVYFQTVNKSEPPECALLETAELNAFWLSVKVEGKRSFFRARKVVFKDNLSCQDWKTLCRAARYALATQQAEPKTLREKLKAVILTR